MLDPLQTNLVDSGIGVVDSPAKVNGRQMIMTVLPKQYNKGEAGYVKPESAPSSELASQVASCALAPTLSHSRRWPCTHFSCLAVLCRRLGVCRVLESRVIDV